MECGCRRGIKLLEHSTKVVEKIFEHRIQQQIDIDDMQFGFMKDKGTTDAIFIIRQMQEKSVSANNNSHGKATMNCLDKASMTITNRKGFNAEPWCIPTFTSKPLLLP